jgi:murein DD-endopeptidase MepM/ murein hydrolase activator NlpD
MKKKYAFRIFIIVLLIGMMVPQSFVMPVENAGAGSYHPKSFWFYPWGRSGTHKGVDIFAREGTNVFSSTYGWVIYEGEIKVGGKVVLILGPKWRIHYYAHLKDIRINLFSFVQPGKTIGTVGTSGNAKGKPPHLHYSIVTLLPYLWQIDSDRQGWKKMFYLNPINYLSELK